MKGFIKEENGAYVRAAIVKLIRIKDFTEEDESDEGVVADAETETVTYAETDDEGSFVIQEVSPDEKYRIEIFVQQKEIEQKDMSIQNDSAEIAMEEIIVDLLEKPEVDAAQELTDKAEINEDPDYEEEMEEFTDTVYLVDSLSSGLVEDTTIENISLKNLYSMSDLTDKPYLRKNNLW